MHLMEAIESLRQLVFNIHSLNEEEWNAFSGIWQQVNYKRKTVLTVSGEIERYLYFVVEGSQRAFYLDDKHPEATIVFTYPGSFSGVADSFLTQTPSRFFLETLTASSLLRTSFQQVSQLMDRHHGIERLIRLAVSHTLRGVLERQVELIAYSAEERFRILLRRSPHILQIIPHKYLASYLGMDASTFSKLISTVRI